MVERESEWDDQQRSRMLALGEYRRALCPGCGLHPVDLDPEENHYRFIHRLCTVCKAEATHSRVLDAEHEKADKALGEKPDPKAPRAGDGLHVSMRRMSEDEVAQAKAKAERQVTRGNS